MLSFVYSIVVSPNIFLDLLLLFSLCPSARFGFVAVLVLLCLNANGWCVDLNVCASIDTVSLILRHLVASYMRLQ